MKGCSSGLCAGRGEYELSRGTGGKVNEPVVAADLGCRRELRAVSSEDGEGGRGKVRTMARLRLLEQPLEPTSLETITVEDVREAVLGIHTRVVSKLGALNEHCAGV